MQDQRNRIDEREDEMEIDLGLLFAGMWKNIRRFWWLALLLTVAGAAGVTVYQRVFHQPMYECSATFTVATGNSEKVRTGATAFIIIPAQRTRCR